MRHGNKILPAARLLTRSWAKSIDYCKKEGNVISNVSCEMIVKTISEEIFYEWQKNVVKCLNEQNDRQILWIWESEGNVGKTSLCKWFVVNRNALVLSGKGSDIKHGVAEYVSKLKKIDDLIFILDRKSVV